MKVSIDSEVCMGHGRCTLKCSAVFRTGDDGRGYVIVPDGLVPPEFEARVRAAQLSCPERAISITE